MEFSLSVMKFVIVFVLFFAMSIQVRSKRQHTEDLKATKVVSTTLTAQKSTVSTQNMRGAANSTLNTNTTRVKILQLKVALKAKVKELKLSAEDMKVIIDEIQKELFKENLKLSTKKGLTDKQHSITTTTLPRLVITTKTTPITKGANQTNSTELKATTVFNTTLTGNTTQNSTISTQKTPAKGGNHTSTPAANAAKRDPTGLNFIHKVSDFPVLFMVSIACTVLLALLFYNRNKIWGVIRRFFHSKGKPDRAYVKVKLEDDLQLPRQANREYIY